MAISWYDILLLLCSIVGGGILDVPATQCKEFALAYGEIVASYRTGRQGAAPYGCTINDRFCDALLLRFRKNISGNPLFGKPDGNGGACTLLAFQGNLCFQNQGGVLDDA